MDDNKLYPIIVSGHGSFGYGMLSTLEILMGEVDNVHAIDFNGDIGSEDLLKIFSSKIGTDVGAALFLVDLLGGTPYNAAGMLKSKNPNIVVIAGCNFPLLFEAVSLREDQPNLIDVPSLIEAGIAGLESLIFDEGAFDNEGRQLDNHQGSGI